MDAYLILLPLIALALFENGALLGPKHDLVGAHFGTDHESAWALKIGQVVHQCLL